ncbi:MAG: hypothetical protein ACKVOB_11545 [Sphingomonas sp.]
MVGISRRQALGVPLLMATTAQAAETPTELVGGTATSPDGRIIAFAYAVPSAKGRTRRLTGIGLLDRATGQLQRVPNPGGRQLGYPCFDSAGGRLACLSGATGSSVWKGVAIVDLATLRATEVVVPASASSDHPIERVDTAIFQPGSGRLLIARSARYPERVEFLLLDPATTRHQVVLPEARSLARVASTAFLSADEIIFAGVGRMAGRLLQEVQAIGLRETQIVLFRLRFGEEPQVLMPALEAQRQRPGAGDAFSGTAVSRSGLMLSLTRHDVVGPPPEYGMQVVRIEPGPQRLELLTATPGRKAYPSIAFDGGVAAFMATADGDANRNNWDLWTLDLRTGRSNNERVLARIVADRRFLLP